MSEQSSSDTERENRKVRSAFAEAISHMETIEPSLETIDAQQNRKVRSRLETQLERLRERDIQTGTDQ